MASSSSQSGPSGGGNASSRPSAPGQLNAAAVSSTQVDLTWRDNSNNESAFKIERLSPGGSGPFVSANVWVLVATVESELTSYSDKSVIGASAYSYRISATNNMGDSAVSSVVTVTTPNNPTAAPTPPSALAATAAAATIINLQWSDNSNNEGYFKLERSANGGTTWTQVAVPGVNATTYQDINLDAATTYTYRIRASNSVGDSAFSANANATTMAAGATNTYTYVSVNIIGPNCVYCHGGQLVAAGYNFNGFANLSNNLTAARNSINANRMPPGSPLSTAQKNAITAWANAGAPNN